MSGWTHVICEDCWNERNPGRDPIRVVPSIATPSLCCYCGKTTDGSIWVREDPADTPCRGVHAASE